MGGKFDLRIFNPPRSPPKIRTPLDLLRVLRNKWEIRTQLPKLAKWADIVFCEWATHYLRWLSKKNYKNILACRMHDLNLTDTTMKLNGKTLILYYSSVKLWRENSLRKRRL